MNLPFSLRKHGGNQRAETIKERQSGYHSVYCAKYAQFTDSVLLHLWFTLRGRGMTVPRHALINPSV